MSQMPQSSACRHAPVARSRWSRATVSAVRADTTCPPCPHRAGRPPTIAIARRVLRPPLARRSGIAGAGPPPPTCRGTESGGARSRLRPTVDGRPAPRPRSSPDRPRRVAAGLARARQHRPAPPSRPRPTRARVAADPRAGPRRPAGTKLCVACRAGRVDDDGYCEHCGHAQPRERDHMEQEFGRVAAVSDRGLRHHRNEDAFALVRHRAARRLARRRRGRLRRRLLRDPPRRRLGGRVRRRPTSRCWPPCRAAPHPQQAMHEAIVAASEAVNALAAEPATAPGARPRTRTPPPAPSSAPSSPAGLLIVGWVGDSRAYWVPDDRSAPPARLTEDDSWAAQMVAAGLMNEAEAYADERAHAITGWLGADAYELEPHTASFKPDRPGVVVVCTDGLWNYAEAAEEMAEAVPADAARPAAAQRPGPGRPRPGRRRPRQRNSGRRCRSPRRRRGRIGLDEAERPRPRAAEPAAATGRTHVSHRRRLEWSLQGAIRHGQFLEVERAAVLGRRLPERVPAGGRPRGQRDRHGDRDRRRHHRRARSRRRT